MVEGYLELLSKPQRVALGLAGDAVKALDRTVRAGTAAPEEIARQLHFVLDAVGTLAAVTAQPLQDFVTRQRELAHTVATLAQAQAELADVFATLAQRQAEVAGALEAVTAPALGLMGATHDRAPAEKSQRSTPGRSPRKTTNRSTSATRAGAGARTAKKSAGRTTKKTS